MQPVKFVVTLALTCLILPTAANAQSEPPTDPNTSMRYIYARPCLKTSWKLVATASGLHHVFNEAEKARTEYAHVQITNRRVDESHSMPLANRYEVFRTPCKAWSLCAATNTIWMANAARIVVGPCSYRVLIITTYD